MDMDNYRRIWVCLEIQKVTSTVTMRGSMLESDFNNIIAGSFTNKFVEIRNTHWATSVMINNKQGIRFIAYGKHGDWKWHSGEAFILVEKIISIALLKDISNLVDSEFENVYESNL
jgi:hypothetical protein